MTRIKKILIVAKQNKLGLKMAMKAGKELGKYIDDIHFDPSTAIRFRKLGTPIKKFDGDLIITIGGDGTFLRTAAYSKVPILPVKIEGHGFLCTCDFKEFLENLSRLHKKDFFLLERMRLKCTRTKKGRFARILHKSMTMAINEIVFARKRPSKILNIEFTIDDVNFEMRGDGILFSTPAGSTAYSASAGGSLIDPNLDVIKIVPLYPFFSKIKPMVIPAGKSIYVKIRHGECAVIIDGHEGEYMKGENEFIIEKGEPIKIAAFEEKNFYQRFKEEFLE
ncbi:MAG TPA: NAD(+)/NADH kinase [archaeon]|nr:NAD(+)/NADH kinase [archaeon]